MLIFLYFKIQDLFRKTYLIKQNLFESVENYNIYLFFVSYILFNVTMDGSSLDQRNSNK